MHPLVHGHDDPNTPSDLPLGDPATPAASRSSRKSCSADRAYSACPQVVIGEIRAHERILPVGRGDPPGPVKFGAGDVHRVVAQTRKPTSRTPAGETNFISRSSFFPALFRVQARISRTLTELPWVMVITTFDRRACPSGRGCRRSVRPPRPDGRGVLAAAAGAEAAISKRTEARMRRVSYRISFHCLPAGRTWAGRPGGGRCSRVIAPMSEKAIDRTMIPPKLRSKGQRRQEQNRKPRRPRPRCWRASPGRAR